MYDPVRYLYAGSSLRMHTLPCAPIRRKTSLFSPYSLKQARNAPPVRACAVVARRRTHTPTHSPLRGSQVTSIINKANRPLCGAERQKMGKKIQSSEYCTVGHPDRTCDYIASYILDKYLSSDRTSRVALEVQLKDEFCTRSGRSRATQGSEPTKSRRLRARRSRRSATRPTTRRGSARRMSSPGANSSWRHTYPSSPATSLRE